MEFNASYAIGLSVVMHVTWNLIARQLPAKAWPMWWVLLAHLIILAPWGIYSLAFTTHWDLTLAAFILISAIANAAYFVSLKKAYERAPVALVYPLVRSSPLLIAFWTTLFMGERLGLYSWMGILISVCGLLVMGRRRSCLSGQSAVPWALTAMLCTSIYSISDKTVVARLPDFASVVGFISIGYLFSFIALTVLLRRSTGLWVPSQRIGFPIMIVGGVCVGLAYALVVHAMRDLASAEVVAYTNAGIVLASLASIFVFKEKTDWKMRILGSSVICAGLLVMSF